MCVLFFAHQTHPSYRLVFAGNRDEAYARPATPAGWWNEHADVLAGRDLDAGGTWLGVTRYRRWSVVTNVRDLPAHRPRNRSRGELTTTFLLGEEPPEKYARRVFSERNEFNPFNLIVGDERAVWIVSTHTNAPLELTSGVYGLSNATLDDPWPKVVRGKAAFADVLKGDEPDPEACLDFLHDDHRASDDDLPETGVGLETERRLSPLFIASDRYGTRASSVILLNESRGRFVERTYASGGKLGGTVAFDF